MATLTRRTVLQPNRLAVQNAAGVRNENRIYIGSISIKGGRNSNASDPPIAAHGFSR
jgi:hypothetical protein